MCDIVTIFKNAFDIEKYHKIESFMIKKEFPDKITGEQAIVMMHGISPPDKHIIYWAVNHKVP